MPPHTLSGETLPCERMNAVLEPLKLTSVCGGEPSARLLQAAASARTVATADDAPCEWPSVHQTVASPDAGAYSDRPVGARSSIPHGA